MNNEGGREEGGREEGGEIITWIREEILEETEGI